MPTLDPTRRAPLASPMRSTIHADEFGSLPFVRQRARFTKDQPPRDFWSVERTGDYAMDYERGVEMARQALPAMRHGVGRNLLSWIVKDMIEKGEFTGVEVGFLGAISATLRAH